MTAADAQALSLPRLDELTRPVAAYPRVSRVGDRSGESYISPEIQIAAMRRWADERSVELAIFPAEENVSGGTMDRPIFNEIMRGITRDGRLGGILVYKLDRFARDLEGGLRTMRELVARRAIFASATEPAYDFTTADGRMMLQQQLMMAEYFRNRTTEAWAASLTYAVGRGVHIAPGMPYGYVKNGSKVLEPNEAAPHVQRAFEMRASGATFQAIADWLNEHAPPRGDGRPWVARTAERMIRRRVYTGQARWGQQINPHAHEPIVSSELWEAAQRKVQTYSKRRQSDEIALLHKIARCAGCSFLLSRALNTSGGRQRHYYRCRVHRVSGTCQHPAAIRGDGDDGLEVYVEGIVTAELDRITYHGTPSSRELDQAMAELNAASEDLAAMQADTSARRRLGSRWLGFVEPYIAAVERAEARVQALRAREVSGITGITGDAYRSLPRPERAEVLRAMIGAIFVRNVGGPKGPHAVPIDRDRVRILWRGEEPERVPATNRASEIIPWRWPETDDETRIPFGEFLGDHTQPSG